MPAYLVLAIVIGLYWPVAWLLSSWPLLLFMIFDSFAIVLSIGALVTLVPSIVNALQRPWPKMCRAHLLVTSLTLMLISAISRFGWIWAWRLFGEPPNMLNHPTYGWGLWVFATAAVTLLVAYQADEAPEIAKYIPMLHYKIGGLCALAAALVLLVLGLNYCVANACVGPPA